MIITALNESPHDARVAITPSVVKHYLKLGYRVSCESNAGLASGFSNQDYEREQCHIVSRVELLKQANIVTLIHPPTPSELEGLSTNAFIVTSIDPDHELIKWCCQEKISLFSMNLIPRISRAQNIDSLSSQANLAGYKAVLEGVHYFNRVIPMMMTAAGMIKPAKVLVLGAGVAGLQAIATAKRLGAIVYAFDVRRIAKEQVESLGAEFIEVDETTNLETSGGYAQEMSKDYQARQAQLIQHYATLSDIIITTALIPGKKAPILIYKDTVAAMKPGSVIVDLATAAGGNCELSQVNKVIKAGEVTLVGYRNFASLVPATASELYANNVLNLIRLMTTPKASLRFNHEDEIIQQALLCHEGHFMPFKGKNP